MNKITFRILLLLFTLGTLNSSLRLQTHSYIYTYCSRDTVVSIDTLHKKKESASLPIIISNWEQNYVKAGNYSLLFTSNSKNNMIDLKWLQGKPTYTLFDFYKHLAWRSSDSTYMGIEYLLPNTSKVLSSRLIQYDLEPGVYIIVDKHLPAWICPDIFITGLEYGIRKFVTRNVVIELKNYGTVQQMPDLLASVSEIFKNISPSSVLKIYPSYPKNSQNKMSIGGY